MSKKDVFLKKLREGKVNPDLIGSLSSLSDQETSTLLETIDDSPYPFEEWLDALEVFKAWAAEKNQKVTLAHQIEYLSCCSEGNLNGGKLLTLSELLKNYLKTHGVEP